jgi:pyruvate,water dikinase
MMLLKKIRKWAERFFIPDDTARRQYSLYKQLLDEDRKCLRLITRFEEIVHRPILVDWSRIFLLIQNLSSSTRRLVDCLEQMCPDSGQEIFSAYDRIHRRLLQLMPRSSAKTIPPYALSLNQAWDYPGLIGPKAYSLARIIRKTTIPVPTGFVVTINAYQRYMEENKLHGFIGKRLRTLNLHRPEHLRKTASVMQKAVLDGTLPSEVKKSISSMMEKINAEGDFLSWAARSSAAGENGEFSFAGQYDSLLKVSPENIFSAYKSVLAGKYSFKALTYRLHHGISDEQTPMAVLFTPMIDASVSGVIYTLDPLDKCDGACLVISAVPGPGSGLVNGSTIADTFLISRHNPAHFLSKEAAENRVESVLQQASNKHSEKLCLDDKSAVTLAKWGLELEALNKAPQDIEWTQNQAGKLFILQSRPIPGAPDFYEASSKINDTEDSSFPASSPPTPFLSVLKAGTPASKGIAAGAVYRISDEDDMINVPQNAILLTREIPSSLVSLLKRVGAVISEKGSKTSHFASVAREFGLPVIVGLGDMSDVLKQEQIVTVNAYQGTIYDGVVEELIDWHDNQKIKPPAPFQKTLAPFLSLISPLNLKDPSSPNFSPESCRSFHDLVRFAHERGTQEMFTLVDAGGVGMRKAKPLDTDIPIVMHVLDLGDGLTGHAERLKSITPEHFQSTPMQAVWKGLTDMDVTWSKNLLHMDWERFDRVSGGIMSLKSSFLGSYALLAKRYAHLLLRFGYHFAVLDTLSGNRTEENYIQFRFKGGGGTSEKKMWRLVMLEQVLRNFDFRVRIRQDMLEAGCKRMDRGTTELRLTVLGYLLGRTPLLDMALDSRENALQMAEGILNKWRIKEKR